MIVFIIECPTSVQWLHDAYAYNVKLERFSWHSKGGIFLAKRIIFIRVV